MYRSVKTRVKYGITTTSTPKYLNNIGELNNARNIKCE